MTPEDIQRIHTLEIDTKGLKTDVSHINEKVDDVVLKIDSLVRIVTNQRQVSWPVIIGCGTFIIASLSVMISLVAVIGNMALTPVRENVDRLQYQQERSEKRILDRVEEKLYYLEKTQERK